MSRRSAPRRPSPSEAGAGHSRRGRARGFDPLTRRVGVPRPARGAPAQSHRLGEAPPSGRPKRTARTRPAPPPARRSRPRTTPNAPRGASRRPTRTPDSGGAPLPAACLPGHVVAASTACRPLRSLVRRKKPAAPRGRPAPDRSHPLTHCPRPGRPSRDRLAATRLQAAPRGGESSPRSPSPRAARGRAPHPAPARRVARGTFALARYVLPCRRGAGVHTGPADRRVHRRATGGPGARRWAQPKLSEPPAGQPPDAAASNPCLAKV